MTASRLEEARSRKVLFEKGGRTPSAPLFLSQSDPFFHQLGSTFFAFVFAHQRGAGGETVGVVGLRGYLMKKNGSTK